MIDLSESGYTETFIDSIVFDEINNDVAMTIAELIGQIKLAEEMDNIREYCKREEK